MVPSVMDTASIPCTSMEMPNGNFIEVSKICSYIKHWPVFHHSRLANWPSIDSSWERGFRAFGNKMRSGKLICTWIGNGIPFVARCGNVCAKEASLIYRISLCMGFVGVSGIWRCIPFGADKHLSHCSQTSNCAVQNGITLQFTATIALV